MEMKDEVRVSSASMQSNVPIDLRQRATHSEAETQAHEAKLSKAQAKRRRKKLRDTLGGI